MDIVKGLLEVVKKIPVFLVHYNIINICFDILSNLRLQNNLYALLICSPSIFEAEHHLCITEHFKWSDEGCLLIVVNDQADFDDSQNSHPGMIVIHTMLWNQ
jgi:hypothetical protein